MVLNAIIIFEQTHLIDSKLTRRKLHFRQDAQFAVSVSFQIKRPLMNLTACIAHLVLNRDDNTMLLTMRSLRWGK